MQNAIPHRKVVEFHPRFSVGTEYLRTYIQYDLYILSYRTVHIVHTYLQTWVHTSTYFSHTFISSWNHTDICTYFSTQISKTYVRTHVHAFWSEFFCEPSVVLGKSSTFVRTSSARSMDAIPSGPQSDSSSAVYPLGFSHVSLLCSFINASPLASFCGCYVTTAILQAPILMTIVWL